MENWHLLKPKQVDKAFKEDAVINTLHITRVTKEIEITGYPF